MKVSNSDKPVKGESEPSLAGPVSLSRSAITGQDDLFFFDWKSDSESADGVAFVPLDLAAISPVRDHIAERLNGIAGLKESTISEDDVFRIMLITDELLANAVLATAANEADADYVMFRLRIRRNTVILSAFDYGGGFEIDEILNSVPDGGSFPEFLASLARYRSQGPVRVRNKGRITEHQRFGRGLRIILGLADSVHILFHDSAGSISRRLRENTIGTIFMVRYIISAAT